MQFGVPAGQILQLESPGARSQQSEQLALLSKLSRPGDLIAGLQHDARPERVTSNNYLAVPEPETPQPDQEPV